MGMAELVVVPPLALPADVDGFFLGLPGLRLILASLASMALSELRDAALRVLIVARLCCTLQEHRVDARGMQIKSLC